MRLRHTIAMVATCSAMVLGTSGVSNAATPRSTFENYTCTGGTIPAGQYLHLEIAGVCSMPDSGEVHIHKGLKVGAGAVLNAATPATVTIEGYVVVRKDAILLLGCSPEVGCDVAPPDRVRGDITARRAASVIIHSVTVHGNVKISEGGGGVNCDPNEIIGSPLYVDVEDSDVFGSLQVDSLETCWLGLIRNKVHRDVFDVFNHMADPDANEVVNNHIGGNLLCRENSPVAQIGDSGGALNKVAGTKSGECVGL